MYDLDGDEKISRDELLAVLHMMVGDNISEDQVSLLFTLNYFVIKSVNCLIKRLLVTLANTSTVQTLCLHRC